MASLTAFIHVFKREIFSANKKLPLKTLFTILVLFALEKLITTSNIYKCPKEGHQLYGAMFLFVPALCLSGVTLLISSSIWDSAISRFKGKDENKAICKNVSHALARAFLVGIAWLVLVFGTTDFYVCFRVGPSESSDTSNEIRAQSTYLAWSILLSVIILGLLYICIKNCCFPHHKPEYTIHSLRDYDRLETEAAVSKFEEEMRLLAEKQGEKQVMRILNEVEDGKDAHEVVRKAKNMLLAKCSRMTSVLSNGHKSDLNGTVVEQEKDTKTLITNV